MIKSYLSKIFLTLLFLMISSTAVHSAVLYYCNDTGSFYSINPATLTETFLFTNASLALYGMCESNITDTMYGANYTGSTLVTVNYATNAVATVGGFGVAIREIAFDRDTGTLYGTNYSSLYTINLSTGVATLVGSFGSLTTMWALGYDFSTNTLFGVDFTTASLYSINTSTGAATLIGTTGVARIGDIYVDVETYNLYAAGNSTTQHLYSLNKSTGTATQLTSTLLTGWAMGLAGPPEPLAIDLLSFEAEVEHAGMALTWETGSEIECLGFNLLKMVYREDDTLGRAVKINDEIIPATGSAYSGASYLFYDYQIAPNTKYRYVLKEIETSSFTQTAGMVDVSTSPLCQNKLKISE